MHKVFRTTTVVFGVLAIVAAFAAVDQFPDGASWFLQFLAVGSAMTPWMIALMIVGAAGEIVKVFKGAET
jgi:hypothetical protein